MIFVKLSSAFHSMCTPIINNSNSSEQNGMMP